MGFRLSHPVHSDGRLSSPSERKQSHSKHSSEGERSEPQQGLGLRGFTGLRGTNWVLGDNGVMLKPQLGLRSASSRSRYGYGHPLSKMGQEHQLLWLGCLRDSQRHD